MPELAEFEAITDHIVAAGNCGVDELTDASTAERAQIFDVIAESRAGGAGLLRKMLGAKDPPPQTEIKEKWSPQRRLISSPPLKLAGLLWEVFGASCSPGRRLLIFPAQLSTRVAELVPLRPFGSSRAHCCPVGPVLKRASEAGRSRRRGNPVKTGFLNAGHLALAYFRNVVAGEIVGARVEFVGFGAMLTNFAHSLEPSGVPNTETACFVERDHSAARAHVDRERGAPQLIRGEPVKIYWNLLIFLIGHCNLRELPRKNARWGFNEVAIPD